MCRVRFLATTVSLGECGKQHCTRENMSEEAEGWFKNEIYFWRCLNFVKYLLVLQELFIPLAVVVLHFSVWHPFTGAFDWLSSFLSIQRLWYHLLLITVTLLLALHNAVYFEVVPTVHSTRLGQLWHNCNPHKLLCVVLYGLFGGIAVRAFLGLSGGPFGELVVACGNDGHASCLNEAHVFLVLHGVFTGVSFYISYLVRGHSYMPFPVIQQKKFMNVRFNICDVLRKAAVDSLKHMYVVYALWCIFGFTPKDWISRSLGINAWLGKDLRTIGGLLDFALLWAAWCSGTVLHAVCELALMLRNIFLTERHQFPVEATFKQSQPQQLIRAMSSGKCLLLQYLGFLDFRFLAEHSPHRRAQVFAVSIPGGHPLHWSGISGRCLSLMRQFSTSLTAAAQLPRTTPLTEMHTSMQTPHRDQSVRLRNLAPDWGAPHTEAGAPPGGLFSPKPKSPERSRLNMLTDKLKKQPLIAYFMAELPEASSRKLFSECQPLIWAVEGLCLLVSASFTEDKFGVVQITLSDILSALLDLEQVLDRHNKGVFGIRRTASVVPSRDVQLRRALGSAVVTGIHHIVVAFGPHLRSITLSEEHRRRLAQFAEFHK